MNIKQELEMVAEFCSLPTTPEIEAIHKRYLSDEINQRQFSRIARDYLKNLKKDNVNKG